MTKKKLPPPAEEQSDADEEVDADAEEPEEVGAEEPEDEQVDVDVAKPEAEKTALVSLLRRTPLSLLTSCRRRRM